MTTQVEQALVDANAIVAQAVPLVGMVSVAVRAIIVLLKAQGKDAEAASFEGEMVKFEAQREALRTAIDDFRTKYPEV